MFGFKGWDDKLAAEAQRRAELMCNGGLHKPATDGYNLFPKILIFYLTVSRSL